MKALLPGTLMVAWIVGQPSDSMVDKVVARVGEFSISVKELLDSYEFGPAFVKRSPDPLGKHLEFMVYERLIALEARELGVDTSSFVRERLAALEEDLAVDQLYRDDILSGVELSEKEIAEGMWKGTTQLRLRWIFTETADDAGAIVRQLKSGIPFASLILPGSGRLDSLEVNYLRLEYDSPDFAEMIRNLRSQEISEPLRGPDGYYVVRIDEIWRNPINRESESEELRKEVVRLLHDIHTDRLASEYVRTKMKTANPAIKANGFNILRAFLADKGLSRDRRLQWNIPTTFMTEAGPEPVGSADKFLRQPLVSFGQRTFTVGDYLRWFDLRQFQLKTHSLAAFNGSVKRTIWRMVQDRLLSEDAYQRGLHRRRDTVNDKEKWEAKLLYLAGRNRLLKQIRIADDELKEYYEQNRHRYRTGNGREAVFDEVKQHVWADLYFDKEILVLARALERLKKEYAVWIDQDLLKALGQRVAVERSPVNILFYKPGGTFPRVAFPSIDESWQRYP